MEQHPARQVIHPQPQRAEPRWRVGPSLCGSAGRGGSSSLPPPVKQGAGVTGWSGHGAAPEGRDVALALTASCYCLGQSRVLVGTLPPPETLAQREPKPPGTLLALHSIPPKLGTACAVQLLPCSGDTYRNKLLPLGLGSHGETLNTVPVPPARGGSHRLSCSPCCSWVPVAGWRGLAAIASFALSFPC